MKREERHRERMRSLWESASLDPDLASGAKLSEGRGWVKTKLSEASIEPPEMLVPTLVPAGMVGSVHGPGGVGKTLVAVYIGWQAMLLGYKVVILDKENGPRIMRERFEMMGADLPALERDGLIAFYDHPAAGRDAETVAGYVAMLEAEKPDIVMFDSWVGFLGSCGFEENSATDIAAWSDLYATPARRRGIAVLLLDHTPKDATNRTARGSSRKRDYVDYQYELEKAGIIDRENTGIITLKLKKDRGAWLKGVHQFRVGGAAEGFVFEPIDAPHDPVGDGLSDGDRATLDFLRDGMTYSEWWQASGDAESTFRRRRKTLVNTDHAHQKDNGTYHHGPPPPPPPNNRHGGSGGDESQNRPDNRHHRHHPKGGGGGGSDGGETLEDFDPTLHRQNPPQGSEGQNGLVDAPGPDHPSSPAGGSAPEQALGGHDVVECIHAYPGGRGCYLCDPEHPKRGRP
jgi:hypothetical protein